MNKDISVAVASILIILAVCFGLQAMRPDRPLSPSQPFVAAAKGGSGPKKVGPNDKIVMHVNGEPITDREFTAFLNSVPEQQRPMFMTPEGKRMLATEIVRMKALEQEGKRLGIADDPALTTQFDLLRTQVTAQRALEKIVNEKVDQQVRAEYEKAKNGTRTLRHIVVAYDGGMIPARGGAKGPAESAAMEKARGIVNRLRGGADFGEIARAESDDTDSAARGGALGPMQPGQLPPEVESAVQGLQPGQVTNPVKTQFGIHVFDLTTPSFDDLRPMLAQRVQQQIAQDEVKRLEAQTKVELDPAFFPPSPTPAPMPVAPKSNG